MAKTVDTKAGFRNYAEGTFTGYLVDPRVILVETGFNARDFSNPENVEHVETLSQSIKSIGVQTPIVVREKDGKIYLVDGESRLRATLKAIKDGAEIKTIPAVKEVKATSDADRVASLLTRNLGKPLNSLERGEVFARLQKFGWKDVEIAVRVGMTAANVSNIMKLYAAPETIKNLVKTGKVAASMAIQAIRDHGDKAADVISEAVDNATAEGKPKATKKNITQKAEKVTQRAPFSFNATESKMIFGALVDLHRTLKGPENKQNRQICINVFEQIYEGDWKEYVKQYAEEYLGG